MKADRLRIIRWNVRMARYCAQHGLSPEYIVDGYAPEDRRMRQEYRRRSLARRRRR